MDLLGVFVLALIGGSLIGAAVGYRAGFRAGRVAETARWYSDLARDRGQDAGA